MKQRPVAIGLLLCEQVIVDERSHNVTPVNCFNLRELETVPGQATFYAVAWLADGIGAMSLKIAVSRLDTLEEIFRVERTVQLTNPLQQLLHRATAALRLSSRRIVRRVGVRRSRSNCSSEIRRQERRNTNMNTPSEGGTFKTINCVDLFIDDPGDTTVRPMDPSLLERVKAERAKTNGGETPDASSEGTEPRKEQS
jgi:hypothetical protein